MDHSTAEKLMSLYQELGGPLNRASELIDKIPDAEEQRRLRRPLGEMMARIWTDLELPIVQEFPDLDPDK